MTGTSSVEGRTVQPLRLLEVVYQWKKTIAVIVGGALLIGVILAFVVPREYKSVTRVLPPRDTNLLGGMAGLSSLVRSLPSALTRFGAPEDPFEFVAILRSRTVLEDIVRRFGLIGVYDVPDSSMEKAVKALTDNTEIDWTEESTLELRVWDRDAGRAAAIANAYIENLNRRSYELQTQEARNSRQFIEGRLAQNKKDLRDAEGALQNYQERAGMVIPLDPTSAAISPIVDLYALKVRREIELGVLLRTVGKENQQYRQVQLELQSIDARIARFPELGMQSLRLFRDVAIQQKIMEIVVPLYEQAKVNEHKDVPVAYVLDPAVPGERPDRPRRVAIVAIAVFLGVVIAGVRVSWGEYAAGVRERDPALWSRWVRLGEAIRRRRR